jgi:bifunctional UDP-N-acetylglucosamine pyrophosphorylase / glucosamine-1-phosphate N-acetyltransferase
MYAQVVEVNLSVIILAAGQGKRMQSQLPKVLQPIGGRPMLSHVVDMARRLRPASISIVYGHGGDSVKTCLDQADLHWCLQAERLGTGHAVMQALPGVDPGATVLVLYGDVPLIKDKTLRDLLTGLDGHVISLLSVVLNEPAGYGRVIRDNRGQVRRIVEEKDATSAEQEITEVNTGILVAKAYDLKR